MKTTRARTAGRIYEYHFLLALTGIVAAVQMGQLERTGGGAAGGWAMVAAALASAVLSGLLVVGCALAMESTSQTRRYWQAGARWVAAALLYGAALWAYRRGSLPGSRTGWEALLPGVGRCWMMVALGLALSIGMEAMSLLNARCRDGGLSRLRYFLFGVPMYAALCAGPVVLHFVALRGTIPVDGILAGSFVVAMATVVFRPGAPNSNRSAVP